MNDHSSRHTGTHKAAVNSIADLLNRSSFGTDGATSLRNRTPTQTAQRAVRRAESPAPLQLLPHDVGDFVGRGMLLRQLNATATTLTGDLVAGVVVLDGQPGVGKTALAVHWAHRAASAFPGGVLYVNLNGFGPGPRLEAAEAVDGFLAALSFPAERLHTAAARAAKLHNLLAGRRVLAILDNVGDSEHVLPLLECLSGCMVVATSRRRLSGVGRRGALSLSVPPLTFQEARNWLLARIGDRALTEPGALEELATLCHGSPLALRGVADHVVTRPRVRLGEFVDELRDTQNLLGVGGDGEDDSVRTAFSWSYNSLTPGQRQLFRQLGAHPGPDISLDAASSLAGRDRNRAKRALDVLVNAHLLTQPESRNRYRFHDLLRKYAAERASDPEYRDERTAAELRLLSFYLHTANNADAAAVPYRRRGPLPTLLEKVAPLTFDNDDAAIQWCLRERANIASIARLAGQRNAHEYAYSLPSATGELLNRLGYHDDTITNLGIAIDSAREAGDLQGEAYSLNNLGYIYLNLRDFDQAESAFRVAKERFDQIGFAFGSAAVMYNRARLQVARGEIKEGIEAHLTALDALRRSGVDGLEVTALFRIAEAYRQAGNLRSATAFARDSLFLATKRGDDLGEGCALAELGSILYEQGDLVTAKSYLLRALELNRRIDAPACKAYNVLAAVHLDENNPEQAERCAQLALTFARKIRDPRGEATALNTIAELAFTQARHSEATQAWTDALTILDDLADPQADGIRSQLTEIKTGKPVATETASRRNQRQRISRMVQTPHPANGTQDRPALIHMTPDQRTGHWWVVGG